MISLIGAYDFGNGNVVSAQGSNSTTKLPRHTHQQQKEPIHTSMQLLARMRSFFPMAHSPSTLAILPKSRSGTLLLLGLQCILAAGIFAIAPFLLNRFGFRRLQLGLKVLAPNPPAQALVSSKVEVGLG